MKQECKVQWLCCASALQVGFQTSFIVCAALQPLSGTLCPTLRGSHPEINSHHQTPKLFGCNGYVHIKSESFELEGAPIGHLVQLQ